MHGMLRLDCFSGARKLVEDDPRWEVHVQTLPQLQTGTPVVGRCSCGAPVLEASSGGAGPGFRALAQVVPFSECRACQNAGLAYVSCNLTTVAMLCRR